MLATAPLPTPATTAARRDPRAALRAAVARWEKAAEHARRMRQVSQERKAFAMVNGYKAALAAVEG